jgi:hypothetical protein
MIPVSLYSWAVTAVTVILGVFIVLGFAMVLPTLPRDVGEAFTIDSDHLPLKAKLGIWIKLVAVALSHLVSLIDIVSALFWRSPASHQLLSLSLKKFMKKEGLYVLLQVGTAASLVTALYAENFDQFLSASSITNTMEG